MGYRVVVQKTKTELSASFLLWRLRLCHTNTNMGGFNGQSADNGSVKKHRETLHILAGCCHGATYAYVLCLFHLIHGKSRENLE